MCSRLVYEAAILFYRTGIVTFGDNNAVRILLPRSEQKDERIATQR
jgi:hypothetical protein